ncbi:MAG: hypothetical protein AB3N64_08740 [Puniceicoccaceae bacterium]
MSAGGGSIKYWEYQGSLAGVICNGPVDTLEEIIVDGETAWKGPLHRGSSTNYSTITLDSRRVVRFYWGTEIQSVDPLLISGGNNYSQSHPAYKGVCYIVLVDFFFGRERTSAPNVEVIVSRKPAQDVLSGTVAALSDGQASPLCSLADFFTHPRYALGLSPSCFDSVSWGSAADQLYQGAMQANTYVSALLNQQVPARKAAAEMFLNADLWLRFNPEIDKIEAGLFPHDPSMDVSGLPLLTADDLTERPRFDGGGWGESETGWAITFTDRDRGFKETTEKHDDLRALRIVGDHRRATLKRPWIMRRKQAFFHVTEYGKAKGQPVITGELSVRRARGMDIRPGDLIRVDMDPEPGGMQLQQVCRVKERTIPQTGPIKLSLEVETGISPVVYIPEADLPDAPQSSEPPEVTNHRIFEMPAPLASSSNEVGVLARRPHGMVTGINVYYDSAQTGSFQLLGVQEEFALWGQPSEGWSADDDGPFEVEIYSSVDRDLLIDDDPGPTAARDNQLLMVCLQIDENGNIAQDANGLAIMEILSIESFVQTGHETYAVTAYRERYGTKKNSFWHGASECWIIPSFGLKGFVHRDFASLQAQERGGYFRLQPFNMFSQRELSSCADIPFSFPVAAAYAPQVSFTTPASSSLQYATPPGFVEFAGDVVDADGNLTTFSMILRASDGSELTLATVPLNQTGYFHFEQTVDLSLPGVFTVIARAQDSSGAVSEAQITIENGQPAGKVATPLISPNGGDILRPQTVSISCSTPDSQIEYKIGPIGMPSTTGSYTPYTDPFLIDPMMRVWARATASGLTDSDYARADFYLDDIYNDGKQYIIP